MKTIWLVSVASATLALSGCSPDAASPPQPEAEEATRQAPRAEAPEMVHRYAKLQQALAGDDFEAAKQAAGELSRAADGEVARLAAEASQADDIAQLRKTFILLSDRLIDEADGLGDYQVAYCPMANDGEGARWVQKDGPIRNPYYGSEMLECGYFPEE